MSYDECKTIEVFDSAIHGRGVFARIPIRKGDLVVPWKNTKEISANDFDSLPPVEKNFIERRGNRIFLVGAPERYVNHSCAANTLPGDSGDVANRDIEVGEEITADYGYFFIPTGSFHCSCRSANCRGLITGNPIK